MKLTKQQAIEGHRKMWNWIANEIEERKHIYKIINLKMIYCHENVLNLRNDCFCCECADSIDDTCGSCILDWGITGDCGLLYGKVVHATSWKEQVKLARQIANLPERKDVE